MTHSEMIEVLLKVDKEDVDKEECLRILAMPTEEIAKLNFADLIKVTALFLQDKDDANGEARLKKIYDALQLRIDETMKEMLALSPSQQMH